MGELGWLNCLGVLGWFEWVGVLGKFNLPHIWDRVLLNTPSPKIKRHAHNVGHTQPNTHTHLNQPNTPHNSANPTPPYNFYRF